MSICYGKHPSGIIDSALRVSPLVRYHNSFVIFPVVWTRPYIKKYIIMLYICTAGNSSVRNYAYQGMFAKVKLHTLLIKISYLQGVNGADGSAGQTGPAGADVS